MRKSTCYPTREKGSRRKPCKNFRIVERANCAAASIRGARTESSRASKVTLSSRFTFPFARRHPSSTILYASSSQPLLSPSTFSISLFLELENEPANSRIRYFVALRTWLTAVLSQPRAKMPFLFSLARLPAHAIIHFESPSAGENSSRQRRRREKLAGELFRRSYFRRKFSCRERVPARDPAWISRARRDHPCRQFSSREI